MKFDQRRGNRVQLEKLCQAWEAKPSLEMPGRALEWEAPLGRGSWGGCAGAQLSLARLGGSCWKFSCALELGINTEPQAPALLACPFHIAISTRSWQLQVDAHWMCSDIVRNIFCQGKTKETLTVIPLLCFKPVECSSNIPSAHVHGRAGISCQLSLSGCDREKCAWGGWHE